MPLSTGTLAHRMHPWTILTKRGERLPESGAPSYQFLFETRLNGIVPSENALSRSLKHDTAHRDDKWSRSIA